MGGLAARGAPQAAWGCVRAEELGFSGGLGAMWLPGSEGRAEQEASLVSGGV